jgi:uncharacterized protein
MKRAAAGWRLCEVGSGAVLVERLQVADNFWSRFWGLQFRAALPAGHGLLLVPCGAVHTCWLRFAIDLLFLDGEGTVLEVRRSVRPWRAVSALRGKPHATLELPAGSATVEPGTRLQLQLESDRLSLPRSLRFLASGTQASHCQSTGVEQT